LFLFEETFCIKKFKFSSRGKKFELDEHIYNILTPSCFSFYNKLLFNVKIPIFDTKIYKITHIIPLPVNNSHFIISPEFLAHDNNTLHQFRESCLKVEQEFFCQGIHTDLTTKTNKCLSDIFKNIKETKCDMIDTGHEMNIFEPEHCNKVLQCVYFKYSWYSRYSIYAYYISLF